MADKKLNKAIHAMKNENWPALPPQELLDKTIAQLKQPEQPHDLESKKTTKQRRFKIMKRFTQIAASIILVAGILIAYNEMGVNTVTAAEILQSSIKKLLPIQSVYIKFRVRGVSHDNFAYINPDLDFIECEMWKNFSETGIEKWKMKKSLRTVVMNGKETLGLIRNDTAFKTEPTSNSYVWVGKLLDLDKVLEQEMNIAKRDGSKFQVDHFKLQNKSAKIKLTIIADAKGDFTQSNWVKNKSVDMSDNKRVYIFDADTHILEKVQVYIRKDGKKTLILETEEIDYNIELSEDLFNLKIPENISWYAPKAKLTTNKKLQGLAPRKTAEVFFDACKDNDWETVKAIFPISKIDERMERYLGSIELLSLGEPFQSGTKHIWFVPYKIRILGQQIKEHNLAFKKNRKNGQYFITGGL